MERVFPANYLLTEPQGEGFNAESIARALAPPAWRERILGGRQSPERRFVRLLRALRSGVMAETRGLYARADFYFEDAYRQFEQLGDGGRIWDSLSARFGGVDARAATACELFLGTHASLIRGYLQLNGAPAPGDRVLKQAQLAEKALQLSTLTAQEHSALRAWLRSLEIGALTRAGKPAEALNVYERSMDSNSPSYFKDAYIEATYEFTTGQLNNGESDEQKRTNAKTVSEGLARLRGQLSSIADRPLALNRLAALHFQEIMAVAGDGSAIPQLATFQRALDEDPFNIPTQRLDVQARFSLSELMETLVRVEAEAAAAGKVLNDEGQSLKRSVVRGLGESNTYLHSAEAVILQEAWQNTAAVELWTSLGLAEKESPDEGARALLDAIGATLAVCELDDAPFSVTLADRMSSSTTLAGMDSTAITGALLELRGSWPRPVAPAQLDTPPLISEAEPLPIGVERAVAGGEDFADWFFSSGAVATRWALAIAAFLVVTAGILTLYNEKVQTDRKTLFPQVMAAALENRHDVVIDLAGRFLSKRPLSGRESVDEAVEQVYAEALVNLFRESPGEPSPKLLEAAQQYSRLVSDAKGERP